MFTKQKYEISLSACQLKQGVSILVSGLHINSKLWFLKNKECLSLTPGDTLSILVSGLHIKNKLWFFKNKECKSLTPGDTLRFVWSGLVRTLDRFITIYTCALIKLRLFGKRVTCPLQLKINYANARNFFADVFALNEHISNSSLFFKLPHSM